MSEKQNEQPMSEEAAGVIHSLTWSAAGVAVTFFLSSCMSGCDKRQTEERIQQQQSEHELKMEHARKGHQYIEKGSWIKQPTP